MDIFKQKVNAEIENLNEEQLKQVAEFVAFLKFRENRLKSANSPESVGEKAPVSKGAELNFNGEMLPIEEIRDRYPREWVLIGDPENDEYDNVIQGTVLVHSPDRDEVYASLAQFKQVKTIAIDYTGPIPEDYAGVV